MTHAGGSGRSAVVFPGMGPTEFASVARFMLVNPVARRLVAVADEVLGYDVFERYSGSPGDYSEAAQVAFFVNCVALATWAEDAWGMAPAFCVGASFGTKAAAVHAGALDFADGVRLTADLVRCETEYFAAEHPDVVTLSFARMPGDMVAELRSELDSRAEWHEMSCYLDHDFGMMSIRRSQVEPVTEWIRARGGLPLYIMDPPLHCRAFSGLRDRVETHLLAGVRFSDPVLPVIADQDGSVRRDAAAVRSTLLDGIVSPVRWPMVVETLLRHEVSTLFVAGPDRLFGRVGVTTRNFDVVRVDPYTATRPRPRPDGLAGKVA